MTVWVPDIFTELLLNLEKQSLVLFSFRDIINKFRRIYGLVFYNDRNIVIVSEVIFALLQKFSML